MSDSPDPVHGRDLHTAGWSWREPRHGDFFRTCSFCGSISPEDLAAEPAGDTCTVCGTAGWYAHFEANRHSGSPVPCGCEKPCHPFTPGGWYASWADQKYGWPHKFYVEGLRPRDPSLLHCRGHGLGGDKPGGSGWVAAGKLTRAQKKIIKADGMHGGGKFEGWYLFGPKPVLFAKFYTVHLADSRISDEVKEKIFQASGQRFHFAGGGRVSWHGAAVPCAEVAGHS